MSKRLILAGCTIVAVLAYACSDSDDPVATPAPDQVLQLRGFDITAANLRETIVTSYVDRDPAFCEAIDGLTPQEAIDLLNEELGLVRDGVPVPGASPISDEAQRSIDDELGAAQIALDECAARSSSPDIDD